MGIGTKVIHCCNIFFLKRSKLICLKSRAPKGKAQSKFCLFLKIPSLYRSHQASYNFLSKRYSEQISWEMQLVQNMTKLDSLNSNTKVIDKRCEGGRAPLKIKTLKDLFRVGFQVLESHLLSKPHLAEVVTSVPHVAQVKENLSCFFKHSLSQNHWYSNDHLGPCTLLTTNC